MFGETTTGSGLTMPLAPANGQPLVTSSVRCELAAGPGAACIARTWLRERLADWLPEEMVADAVLVVTELVANAVAVSSDSASIGLLAHLVGPELLVEVFDRSSDVPRARCTDPLMLDEDGRGLLLVAELTRAWGWHPVTGGKVVWALLPPPPDAVSRPYT